ncbi:MAG TPA: MBL fold metallo-hydrolase [Hyphomicrobiales bacterium]|nr:MBL fold metallo-hydrolase [Hyphomicrobiales bacterium]
MTDLAEQIFDLDVPRRSIAIWFLGQNGWIVKSPGGTVIAVDPYLSDAIKGRQPGLDTSRQVPLPLSPDRLKADLFLCTHSHADHADPQTIANAHQAGTRRFAGPRKLLRFLKARAFRETGGKSPGRRELSLLAT